MFGRTSVLLVSTARPHYEPVGPDELVLGLVYGSGAETEQFQTLLGDSLQRYGYDLRTIHLSNYLPALLGKGGFTRDQPYATRDLQDMGDDLRAKCDDDTMLARLAIFLIAAKRSQSGGARVAWLVRSLKRPEEVRALRQVYGSRFILFGLHVPEVVRRRNAERRWQRWANVTSKRFEEEVTRDIRRDEEDRSVQHGQALRNTFAEADFFVDGRSVVRLGQTLPRAVQLVFGEPFVPPERDEQAMYHAFAASLRSTEMGRQVGAAIVDPDGDLLAVGTNDVPSAKGGLYWSPDHPDGRDFAQASPTDSNTLWQRRVARELLAEMARTGWLDLRHATDLEDGDYDISEQELDAFLAAAKPTRFRAMTEFGRSVHAEMDAITTSARIGVPVKGATIACTTFPCHNCTRHLIAAGIRRALYIHPYPKSLARDLHGEALVIEPEHSDVVDNAFVLDQYTGVAPRVYPQYFGFGQDDRKDAHGRAMTLPNRALAEPRVLQSGGVFAFGGPAFPGTRTAELEEAVVVAFEADISDISGLALPTPSQEEDER